MVAFLNMDKYKQHESESSGRWQFPEFYM